MADTRVHRPKKRLTASNPERMPKPIRPYYSNCVRVETGPLLFISGQIALDANGALVGAGDVRAQARQTLENLRFALESEGAAMSDVIKVTVFVTDISCLDQISDIRSEYFPIHGPASSIVEVSALALPELLIEIEAVAAVRDRS